MRVLFIGGSGIISSACSRLAAERQRTDARIDAVMDKLIATYRPR